MEISLRLLQQLLNIHGYLGSLDGDALTIKVHVIHMVLGMAAHGRIQIFHRDALGLHKFGSDRVPSVDTLVRRYGIVLG